ncbi:MAG: hypothetical protein ETSY1_18860 [Candidatus Entotheonella factor]|uniref:Group II intron maturase-specific domain-containing protein n=1 Tax=Entotheonella factor TaxID=1429438 RepID=W4LJY8_ENTF1|nr:MAG: hypothetical protein ETSY1_18860 [Candidatus Entotheonella factor]
MMGQLRLTINEEKTHICRIPQESFDFLGYTFGRCYSTKTGRAYLGTHPSEKKIKQLCGTIHDLTARRWLWMEEAVQVRRLNEVLGGWANYFCLGAASPAYRCVSQPFEKIAQGPQKPSSSSASMTLWVPFLASMKTHRSHGMPEVRAADRGN